MSLFKKQRTPEEIRKNITTLESQVKNSKELHSLKTRENELKSELRRDSTSGKIGMSLRSGVKSLQQRATTPSNKRKKARMFNPFEELVGPAPKQVKFGNNKNLF